MKRKLSSPPPDKQNTPGILYNMYRRCNDGSALNLDDFFYFFGECCLKKMSLVQTIFFFFLFLKIRVYKRNNEELIDASLFLFFVDPLLD